MERTKKVTRNFLSFAKESFPSFFCFKKAFSIGTGMSGLVGDRHSVDTYKSCFGESIPTARF